ncbi:hypothetical protein [Streptomyces ipomoeae]|uniref:hypothetical protein n=1 Tax=Streptomyces ipomoeae TaxID=103232 RepID=UPI0015F10029|nr:hypothetical protein [Streptomyces ipomoeae]MDX2937903.1 hypothetical protein [Streptomyces ipomoeae]
MLTLIDLAARAGVSVSLASIVVVHIGVATPEQRSYPPRGPFMRVLRPRSVG